LIDRGGSDGDRRRGNGDDSNGIDWEVNVREVIIDGDGAE
jgi:hypothetical protein